MTQVEELFEVYLDIPEVPRRELCELAVNLVEDRDPLIDTLKEQAQSPYIVPDEVVDCLVPLIDTNHPERPLAWHFARAVARKKYGLHPKLDRDAEKVLKLALQLITSIAESAEGFLLDGLFAMAPEPWVLEHLETEFCPAALDVVARSRRLVPTELPRGLVKLAVQEARSRIEEVGTRHDDDAETLLLPANERDTIVLGRWLGGVLDARDDAAFLLASVSMPWPISIATSPDVVHIEDNLYEVDGVRWLEVELNELLGRERALLAQHAPGRQFCDVLCSPRKARFPKEAAEAGEAALALVHAQPGLIDWVVRELGAFGDGIESHRLVALAEADQRLLVCIAEQWPRALEDATELVENTSLIESVSKRVEVLLAIGAPAKEALAKTARELLDSGTVSGFDNPLVRIADTSTLLNLSFWEKYLARPGTFQVLHGSKRLTACWQLRPQPLAKAMKALTRKGHIRDAVAILMWLSDKARPALQEAASDAIELIERAVVENLSERSALFLLARIVTQKAKAAARLLFDRIEFSAEDALENAVYHDALWELFSERGLVDGHMVMRWAYGEHHHCSYVAGAAARALVGHVLSHGLGDMAEVVASDPRPLAQTVYWERTDEEARRIGELLPGFEQIRFPDHLRKDLDILPRDEDPKWMEALLDDDRARLLPEIGELCASHLDDNEWARAIPELLRGALHARCSAVLGSDGDRLMQHLGDRWPTQSALQAAAAELDLALDSKDLDRCADEGLPPFFRAVVAALPGNASTPDELVETSPVFWLEWILGECWVDEPALVARHLVGELEKNRSLTWVRGVALALVALREPVGTTVPKALTRLSNQVPEAHDFLIRQRDTFARESAAAERSKPAAYRTRQALVRLKRATRDSVRALRQA